MFTKQQRKLIFLSSLGGVLEFYDFIIYALLAGTISKAFFPAQNSIVSLLTTFATFSVGYLVRPLGGILFGHFGDKFGRKTTFTISILMMALATFCIGLVPSYQSIGIAGPLILTALRIIQGLSIGGEIPSAIAYVSETIPDKKGFATGIIFCSLINGIVLGSLAQGLLTYFLSAQQLLEFGWRIPFLIGGIFGFCSYLLRKQLNESPLFQAMENKTEAYPLFIVFKDQFRNALLGTLIVALGATYVTLLFLFIPSYLNTVLHQTNNNYIWYNTIALFLVSLLNMFSGFLSDKFNKTKMMVIICLITILFSIPIFVIYAHHFNYFHFALLMSTLFTGFAWGIIPSLLSELFPTKIRCSGVAVCYNLGFGLFGGLTPLIAMFLIYKTGLVISPAFYLLFTSILAFIAILYLQPVWLKQRESSSNLIGDLN